MLLLEKNFVACYIFLRGKDIYVCFVRIVLEPLQKQYHV
jgi:hypothetical protein